MSGLGLFRLHQPGLRNSSSSDDEPRHTPSPPGPNPHRVKRALFGPTDHEENLRFVRKELKKAKNEAANKWNFDFDNGTPLEGRYSWEEAAPSDLPLPYLQPLAGVTETDGSESKENRVSSSSSSSSPSGPTAPTFSVDLPTSSTVAQRPPDPLSAPPEGSLQDLRTPAPPPPHASASSSAPPEASAATPSSSSEMLGARMKDVTKEKKITDAQYQFKSRKSRSKSSSKLRLKRLGGGIDGTTSRSPSVKGRGPMQPRDSEDAPLVPKAPLVPQSTPLTPQAPMVPLARGRRREGGGTSSDES